MVRKKAVAKNAVQSLPKTLKTRSGPRLFVWLPFRLVRRQAKFLAQHGLGAEIVLYDTNWICKSPVDEVSDLAAFLEDAGIEVAVHGPIYDLNPGSLDSIIRDYTLHCYFKTLSICHALGAKSLVLHLGINPLLPESALDSWLEGSLRMWKPVVDMAEQLRISIRLENMFLPSPKFLVTLRAGLHSDAVKICFDIGHFHVYSKVPLTEWLDEIGSHLAEVHLNDNAGTEDEHLAIGKGAIDFKEFFDELAVRKMDPDFTLEMTSEKFEESLSYLAQNNLLSPFMKS